MKLVFILLFVMALWLPSAHARLGFSYNQCVRQYGPPQSEDKKAGSVTFLKGSIKICISFYQGKAERMCVAILDKGMRNMEIKPDAHPLVLELCVGPLKWEKVRGFKGWLYDYRSVNGGYWAACSSITDDVTVVSNECLERERAALAQRERDKVDEANRKLREALGK